MKMYGENSVETNSTNTATVNPAPETSKVNTSQPVSESKEKKKKEKKQKEGKKKHTGLKVSIIIILLAIIAGAVGSLVYFLFFSATTIDLAKYIDIEYKGYDGYASADIEINEKELKNVIKDSSVAKKFIKKVELEADNEKNLSNGDEIKIKVTISDSFLEENKLKLKENKIKIKVEGLEEFSSLDLSDYIVLEYKGFNKYASATATLDESLEELLGKSVFKDLNKEIVLTVSNNGKLENGKNAEVEITISDSWLNENGISLKSNTAKVKVSGLEEATEVDAFEAMKVNITGMSPNINISVTNESSDEFLKTVKFKASKTSGVSNGEKITITADSWDEDMANEKGYVLKETSTDYTVDGQAAYIYNTSEITDSLKSEIKSLFVEKAKSKATDAKWYVAYYTDYQYVENRYDYDKDLTAGTPELVSMYLLTKKEDSWASDTNKLVGILRVPFTSSKNGVTYNWYITVIAKNFSTKTDGSISDNTIYDVNDSYGEDEEKAYSEWVNAEKYSFNVESISVN